MKVYAISDLHLSFNADKPMDVFGEKWENYEAKIKDNVANLLTDEDILIIAGDLSWAMQMAEVDADFDYISSLKGKKIVVRGNHDYWWKSITAIRDKFEPREIYALQNDSIKFGKFVFAGTRGWVVPETGKGMSEEDKKIYNRELIRLEMALESASKRLEEGDELIAVLHYPPFNSTLDDSEFTGLLERFGVTKCVYGHLHGKTKHATTVQNKNGIEYYLSSCDKIGFTPILISQD